MSKKKFDYIKLNKLITDKRFQLAYEVKENVGLRSLSNLTGVSAATLSRLQNGKKIDIDTILLLLDWLKKDIKEFVK